MFAWRGRRSSRRRHLSESVYFCRAFPRTPRAHASATLAFCVLRSAGDGRTPTSRPSSPSEVQNHIARGCADARPISLTRSARAPGLMKTRAAGQQRARSSKLHASSLEFRVSPETIHALACDVHICAHRGPHPRTTAAATTTAVVIVVIAIPCSRRSQIARNATLARARPPPGHPRPPALESI